jgi:hypothetical protein
MPVRELLTEWHQKASLAFASRFLIVPRFEQQKIDFIRDTFLRSFPARYFQIKIGQDIATSKINWIKSLLLVPTQLSAVKALYEISLQLNYCKSEPALWEEFTKLQTNPINLRSFFFEVFVYKTFDDAHIPTIKKPVAGGQALEGYCTLNGKDYLFECKLPYLPSLEELFLVQRLMNDFYQFGARKSPLNGYIASIYLQRPLSDKHRVELGQKIATFYNGLPTGVDMEIDYDNPGGAGLFQARTFSKERLERLEQENKADIIFYMAPTGEIGSNGEVRMEGKVVGKFNILRNKLYKKLESILKAEKEQHPPDAFPRKVLFIGSESFPEFQFGLFQHDNMFDLGRVVLLCNKLDLRCIVCFIRKYYQRDSAYIVVDTVAPPELMDEAKLIKHIFSSIVA